MVAAAYMGYPGGPPRVARSCRLSGCHQAPQGACQGESPVSYRSFKHLLGETSLERKCRFIFGGGILVLVTCSFYWYGRKTEWLVINQTTQTARMLVKPTLMNLHYKATGDGEYGRLINMLW